MKRFGFLVGLACLLVFAAPLSAQPVGPTGSDLPMAGNSVLPVTLKADDGVAVPGRLPQAASPRALILLLHPGVRGEESRAAHPGTAAAVLAFSPGEYLGGRTSVTEAARKVRAPIFVTSANDEDEIAAAREIVAASPATLKTQFVPIHGGVHGSSTLIKARNASGAASNWTAVFAFLSRAAQ